MAETDHLQPPGDLLRRAVVLVHRSRLAPWNSQTNLRMPGAQNHRQVQLRHLYFPSAIDVPQPLRPDALRLVRSGAQELAGGAWPHRAERDIDLGRRGDQL